MQDFFHQPYLSFTVDFCKVTYRRSKPPKINEFVSLQKDEHFKRKPDPGSSWKTRHLVSQNMMNITVSSMDPSTWWLNQPSWKNRTTVKLCSCSPNIAGWNFKKKHEFSHHPSKNIPTYHWNIPRAQNTTCLWFANPFHIWSFGILVGYVAGVCRNSLRCLAIGFHGR